MKKYLLIIFLTVFFSFSGFPQLAKYSNEFLSIGVGARSLAMANAQVASVSDVTSGYWNPAGLVQLSAANQVGLMHAEYFAGVAKYDYAAFAMKIDTASAFSASVIRFGIDDIPNTLDLYDDQGNVNYDRISKFSAADYAAIFSYARKSPVRGLHYGANFKIIYRQIGNFAKAYGFGLDAGIQYHLGQWRFAAVGKDITSTFNAWTYNLTEKEEDVLLSTGNELPDNSLELTMPRLILGGARTIKISNSFSSLIELDMNISFDGKRNTLIRSRMLSIDPGLGLEVDYKKIVFLRAGVGNFQEETDFGQKTTTTFQPNIGLGICIKNMIHIDYALTDIGDQSIALYSNVFSLRVDFGKNP
ncbi:MAG: PorV/PorQ family protein [Bacteroidales bacterium]